MLHIKKDETEVLALCNQDPIMKRLIQVIGDLEINMRPDFMKSLVRSMIGQLISVQAAEAIFNRLGNLLNQQFTAENILQMSDQHLRQAGLSKQKISYLRDLATKISDSEIDLQSLTMLDNQTIIDQLTRVKGIGNWTAEMFLIFSLGRMDVLALDDIGTQQAAAWLYHGDKSERRKILQEKAVQWEPHYTIASFYLWEAVLLNYVKDYPTIEALEATM
jgi:DNA-3-methyladenine glycosylase II